MILLYPLHILIGPIRVLSLDGFNDAAHIACCLILLLQSYPTVQLDDRINALSSDRRRQPIKRRIRNIVFRLFLLFTLLSSCSMMFFYSDVDLFLPPPAPRYVTTTEATPTKRNITASRSGPPDVGSPGERGFGGFGEDGVRGGAGMGEKGLDSLGGGFGASRFGSGDGLRGGGHNRHGKFSGGGASASKGPLLGAGKQKGKTESVTNSLSHDDSVEIRENFLENIAAGESSYGSRDIADGKLVQKLGSGDSNVEQGQPGAQKEPSDDFVQTKRKSKEKNNEFFKDLSNVDTDPIDEYTELLENRRVHITDGAEPKAREAAGFPGKRQLEGASSGENTSRHGQNADEIKRFHMTNAILLRTAGSHQHNNEKTEANDRAENSEHVNYEPGSHDSNKYNQDESKDLDYDQKYGAAANSDNRRVYSMSQWLKSAESFQEHNPMEALEAGNKEDDTSKKKTVLNI